MKPPDIIEVTLKVVEVFSKLKIKYYIGGSLASSVYGVARATMDVDIVANIRLEHMSMIEQGLKKEFYVDIDMIRNAIHQQSSFNLIHLETLFKIDIFILKDLPFNQEAFSRRIQKAVSEDSSLQLYFSTPEDIILIKLEWYKSREEASDRQWNDILGVMKVQGSQLDRNYLEHWAGELGVSRLLEKAFDDAGIFKTAG